MDWRLPEPVSHILNTLKEHGHEAFVVGGCVRDHLRGVTPADYDIATSALPETVLSLFERTIETGRAHGTITVFIAQMPCEVTTFRTDGSYSDHRRPDSVAFSADIREDLARRDFTMNAVAYDGHGGLIDPFGGAEDIRRGVIRCVGEPGLRFREDALRMLRAVRFAAQTGFSIEDTTRTAILENAGLVTAVSQERILAELDKLLLSERPETAAELYQTGLMGVILPELCPIFTCEQHIKYHLYDVGTHTMVVLKNVPARRALRYAAFFHDAGKPAKKTVDADGTTHFKGHAAVSCRLAETALTRLKMDNRTKDAVLRLVKYHDREILVTKKAVKRAVFCVGEDIFEDLMALKRGDALGQNLVYSGVRLGYYDEILRLYRESREEKEPFGLKDLAIDGHGVMAHGFHGPEVGRVLENLLLYILDNPEDNKLEKINEMLNEDHDLWLKPRERWYIMKEGDSAQNPRPDKQNEKQGEKEEPPQS